MSGVKLVILANLFFVKFLCGPHLFSNRYDSCGLNVPPLSLSNAPCTAEAIPPV